MMLLQFYLSVCSILFVYCSQIITTSCDDEKGDKQILVRCALISSILLALACIIYMQEYILMIILLGYSIVLYLVQTSILHTIFSRIAFYIALLLTLNIQPLLVFNLSVIEFFSNTFTEFNIKYEVWYNLIFYLILCVTFLFSFFLNTV